jgi:hypothetical protein
MSSKLKNNELTIELFNSENINKNDIVFAVLYVIHKHGITILHKNFLEYISNNYPEYRFDILLQIPSNRVLILEQLLNVFGALATQDIKKLFEKFKDDESFCKKIIKKVEYHKNAAEHGLFA